MSASAQTERRRRVALVTGATGSIGRAVCERLAEDGADLGLCDLSGTQEAASDIAARHGARTLGLDGDLTSEATIEDVFTRVEAELGSPEILVTVAGITSTGPLTDLTAGEWDRVAAINLRAVFLCNRAAARRMKAGGFGRIVNMGSVLAKNGGNPRPWLDESEQQGAANAAYGAAKAGVHALTLFLAREVAHHGITVNAVAPGPIASPMTTRLPESLIRQIPVGRLGRAEEVADTVAFLCRESSGFITGEIIDVNGGLWVD